jgi:hypothetical protein
MAKYRWDQNEDYVEKPKRKKQKKSWKEITETKRSKKQQWQKKRIQRKG